MTREEAIILIECSATELVGAMAEAKNDSEAEQIQRYIDAYDMAISAIRQKDAAGKDVGKWISVKDRLPDYMGEVLVIVSGKPCENITLDGAYELAEYDPVEGWILEMWPEWCSGVVTHWMPLPEPPEEDEAK